MYFYFILGKKRKPEFTSLKFMSIVHLELAIKHLLSVRKTENRQTSDLELIFANK
jgi:hypothetical protein